MTCAYIVSWERRPAADIANARSALRETWLALTNGTTSTIIISGMSFPVTSGRVDVALLIGRIEWFQPVAALFESEHWACTDTQSSVSLSDLLLVTCKLYIQHQGRMPVELVDLVATLGRYIVQEMGRVCVWHIRVSGSFPFFISIYFCKKKKRL